GFNITGGTYSISNGELMITTTAAWCYVDWDVVSWSVHYLDSIRSSGSSPWMLARIKIDSPGHYVSGAGQGLALGMTGITDVYDDGAYHTYKAVAATFNPSIYSLRFGFTGGALPVGSVWRITALSLAWENVDSDMDGNLDRAQT